MTVVTGDQQRLAIIAMKKEKGEVTKQDILSIKDFQKRRTLIRENRELFAKKK